MYAIRSYYEWDTGQTFDDGGADVLAYKQIRDAVGDLTEIQLARVDTTSGRVTNFSVDIV